MSDERAVLVGMNNPYDTDPRYALYPLPRNTTGWRVWSMLNGAEPRCTLSDYTDAFDRRNLQTGHWINGTARWHAQRLFPELRGRTVLVFGARLRDVFQRAAWWLDNELVRHEPRYERLELVGAASWRGVYLHWVPHPSGLNRWYNEPANRDRVSVLLTRLYRGERGVLL